MEEEASHFQVIDGESAMGVGGGNDLFGDVGGPLDSPHCRV